MRLGILALLLASGCSLVQSLPKSNAPPRERETVYAVIGTFVVMATVAGLIPSRATSATSPPTPTTASSRPPPAARP